MESDTALTLERYHDQQAALAHQGRHILAQFDDEVRRRLPGIPARDRSLRRPARSFRRRVQPRPHELDQAELPVDDVSLRLGHEGRAGGHARVWLRRAAFEEILQRGGPSSFVPEVYASHDDWQAAVAHSSVRLQWDPDHDPSGHLARAPGDPAWPAWRRAGPVRRRVAVAHRGHLAAGRASTRDRTRRRSRSAADAT